MPENKLANLSLINHPQSRVNAYGEECLGCQATGAKVMLTVGSTISVLNSNNQEVRQIYPEHIDIFLTNEQAQDLINQLKKVLLDNCFIKKESI